MFIKEVRVLRAAVADMESASAFYEGRQPGTGDIFWDSLRADLELLMVYGGIHAKKSGFHRMLAKRFPYAIYYRVKDEIAYVAAILPMRRDPTWIKQQLEIR
jgi:plasmid stabilization system protein ParE